MPRPRTVNKKIPDLPRGMRKVGEVWYWRGTDGLTKEIEAKLREAKVPMRAGTTPVQARLWWERHISPALVAAVPDDDVVGTLEEIIRKYEADELAAIKREATKTEYQGRIKRLRAAFRTKRYPKAEVQALLPGYLSAVTITQHLHANRERASSANKDIQLLSRMFRLARVRWGLTTFNPCEGIEYLPEAPRDQYVSDQRYAEIYSAASPVLQCMLEISTQTGARVGMIFDIRIGDFDADHIDLRVTKKRNDKGYTTKAYTMTPDLWAALTRALDLRKKNRGGAASLPSDYLFITKQGNPYGKEAFKTLWRAVRTKLGLASREITFHDMRAKAASDSDSDVSAQELLHHEDVKVTKRVYRRKVPTGTPLPSAIGGRGGS
ncbi:Site-specific recombinase XerD [Variovorax sp. YR634]|uniref:site-specific integrase n=1 Tax=Variovorax sp. YR634 TaxID=1884385 RepID=UPI000899AD35|nr:tyrosine-type recombinase/integrase [Variovorax sp. YR634]SDX16050.1 Site-specific recombinase XerD [Variovorax sp. YR634]